MSESYFHTPVLAIWQIKDYKERNNFILRTTFGKCLFPCQNACEKCPTKTEFCNGKSYIKKLYTLDCSCNALASSRIVTHSNAASFSMKTNLCETRKHSF